MTKTYKLNKKRVFRGNRYKKVCKEISNDNDITSSHNKNEPEPRPSTNFQSKSTPPSASSKKIGELPSDSEADGNNNVILSVNILTNALLNSCLCKYCKKENSLFIEEDIEKRQGLACSLAIICSSCKNRFDFWSSAKSDNYFDINLKCVYGLRSIGKGSAAGKLLFGMLDLPNPPQRFERHNPVLLNALETVANASMLAATEEAVQLNNTDETINPRDLSVGIDGTWQRKGYSSLNGVVSASSFDTGKILDVEVMTKYCHTCKTVHNKNHAHFCSKNFEGSSGAMEVEGAVTIFGRSLSTRNVRYQYYLGDGDSKGFHSVVDSKPYGDDLKIEKLECVGHVQKRMGGWLRKLRREMKGKLLSDGLRLGGKKGRLTDSVIDSLQNYYGLAIRRNKDNLEKMKRDVWSIFFHKASTDENPQHGLCDEAWCRYKQAEASNQTYRHKNSLDPAVIEAIKPTFKHLSQPDLLSKCLHGRTQNLNESFNSVLWSRIPKVNFVCLQTLKCGTYDAVITFNEGSRGRLKVFNQLGLKVSQNCLKTLYSIDKERVLKADKACTDEAKQARKRSRMVKKKLLDTEKEKQPDYEAGMF